MNVRLKFLGAAQSVTGSKFLLELDNRKVLIDCGLFQGKKELRLRNWDRLPIEADKIDLVVITHAHIDHTGYLPRLIKDGFRGRIVCTHATKDLMRIMLKDAAKLQEEEAQFAFKKGYSKHSKPEPLFTEQDAEKVFEYVDSVRFDKQTTLFPNLAVRFQPAGHILGSAIAELFITGKNQKKKIVFSGDLGRSDDPIMNPPSSITEADILLVESTYGDRLNPMDQIENDLIKIIVDSFNRNGAIIIPAFAVGRTQLMIYHIQQLMKNKLVPTMPVYVDSPMAISVTDLYEKHAAEHKIKITNEGGTLMSIFDDPTIHYCHTPESSRALNDITHPCIIISASGMATGGRVLHHLYHRLPNENDTVLIAGFQAEGSRGRRILEGEPTIKIFGEEVPVHCHVKVINGLSAHADQSELLGWISKFKEEPKMTFIIHGEPTASEIFANKMIEMGWKPIIPQYLEAFQLFTGI
jgi:metallo-beta-lactamase family protein